MQISAQFVKTKKNGYESKQKKNEEKDFISNDTEKNIIFAKKTTHIVLRQRY